MNLNARTRTVVTLAGFVVLFVTLAVRSYVRESATWDEPQHLTTGYVALARGDYRIDPEHPPLLRLWAALPLWFTRDIKLDTRPIDAAEPTEWVGMGQFFFCHDFLYRQNDADRLLYRARFMIVLLGVALGALVFFWARELFGFGPATLALALYTLEPNLLAHSRLVTTDLGVTFFVVGTVYFLWRVTRQLTVGNVAGLVAFFALTHVSKFSAVLLWPVVGGLLIVWAARARRWLAAAGIAGLLFVTTWLAIWAVYGFRYLPSAHPQWRYQFPSTTGPSAVAGWADRHRLLPNAYTQGFLLSQSKAQQRGAFLAGRYSVEGWWYYFPAALAIKLPVTLLLLGLGGFVLCATRPRAFLANDLFLLLPAAVFLGAAMTAKLNIGVRHVLVLSPLLILLAAKAGRELSGGWRALAWVPLAALLVFEFYRVSPHYLAFLNSLVGGPRQGYRYLVDSNLDWGQDLKGLKRWMDTQQVPRVNLCYFGTADPAYYGINCTHLPGAPFFAESQAGPPQLPGYVAVSATQLQGAYFPEPWRSFYRKLLDHQPVAVIGHSIFVYRLDSKWW
jgi:hypothetical protein